MRGTLLVLASVAALIPTFAGAQGFSSVQLLSEHGSWSAYSAVAPNGQKVCFVRSKPSQQLDGGGRGQVFLMISNWPEIRNQVSLVMVGSQLDNNSDVAVHVGGSVFPMYGKDDAAWIRDRKDETRLVDLMRANSSLTVQATSPRRVVDNYALSGFGDALARTANECQLPTSTPPEAPQQPPGAAVAQEATGLALFQKYNLIGTYAYDCSKVVSKSNEYFVHRPLDVARVQRDTMNGPTERIFLTVWERGRETRPNVIALTGTVNGQPSQATYVIDANRMRIMESMIDGRQLIANGRFTNGAETQWVNKCA